ncbi:MAG: glycosyltransferase family 4 protein [Bacteroidetes bacterium]|nr:glycosyltransferase family 4 protein [Bacteroidota bacterium]
MNILMFSPSYGLAGGAVIAANRLFHGLLFQGADVKMLVGKMSGKNDRVNVIQHNFLGEKILSRLTLALGLNYIHYYSSFRIPDYDFFKEADVLNFHTIHSGYFNYLALPKLTRLKPAVFTLHDMWSFTGHCGFSYRCEKWKTGCGKCPYLNEYPSMKWDNSAFEWKLKKYIFKRSKISIVVPSKWLLSNARQSILNHFTMHHIPNGLNLDTFRPLDQLQCKKMLNIPAEKKVLLFAAMGLSDHRKGGDLLYRSLCDLPQSMKKSVVLLTMGHPENSFRNMDIQTCNLGYISGDGEKAVAFSAADLYLFPSRADNFPCIVQESIACGTPVVAFDVGGIPELVRPGITGLLAVPGDTTDFLARFTDLLDQDDYREKMRLNCRRVALEEYGIDVQVKSYLKLFSSLVN